jgi:hypothetical protein
MVQQHLQLPHQILVKDILEELNLLAQMVVLGVAELVDLALLEPDQTHQELDLVDQEFLTLRLPPL